jgi:hypothetical protein
MAFIQLQFRRGTSSEWNSANTILALGELGLETDTNQFKIGNGASGWIELPYGGLVGPQGDAGANGVDGISVTSANIVSGNLILTLSNSDTIDAGFISGAGGSSIANGFTSITIPEENGDIVFDLDDNNSVFRFKVDGTIQLPEGGTITEDIVTDNPTIKIAPANANVNSQMLLIKGGAQDDYHLHLTTGDLEETSIILGTDAHNIRTTTDGAVRINAYDYGAEEPVTREWTFDNIGQLMFPDFSFQSTAFTGTANVAWSAVPTANSSPGTAGEVAYDVNGDLYICVAANTWSKIAGTFIW